MAVLGGGVAAGFTDIGDPVLGEGAAAVGYNRFSTPPSASASTPTIQSPTGASSALTPPNNAFQFQQKLYTGASDDVTGNSVSLMGYSNA